MSIGRGVLRLGAILAMTLLALGVPGRASAQSLIPEQGVQFGTIQPGVDTHVSPDDPNRGALTLIALGRLGIRILPPAALVSPQGHQIPFSMGATDAVVRWWGGNSQYLPPGQTTTVNGRLFGAIYLGGTVSPSAGQGAGTYSGAIVVQIVAPGT